MRLIIALALFILSFANMPAFAQQKGDIVLKTDFNENETSLDWTGTNCYRRVVKDGVYSLRIKKKNGLIHLQIPAEKIRGTKVLVSVRLKTENVRTPGQPWNGVKVMLYVGQPWNEAYVQQTMPAGSYDWTVCSFPALIPEDADSVSLVMGLERVKGKIWFDNAEIKIIEGRSTPVEKSTFEKPVAPINYTTQLRGVMVPTFLNVDGLNTLAGWGANHIRWQLTWEGFPYSYADTASYTDYRTWLDGALNHLDTMLLKCRQLGIKVVIDLHTLPGGRQQGGFAHKIFREKNWQDAFLTIWKDIANRYKNEPAVWGYDLANEPVQGIVPGDLINWQSLAALTAAEVRNIDKEHVIIIEGDPNGVPDAMVALKPIPVEGVVYSFHMYVPESFTHQRVGGRTDSVSYPGKIGRWQWDIATMRKSLQSIVKWQRDNNAQIYVGEFSAIRWAPGESAYYYLRDCISLFEEYGWNWAYHAFREYDGWSVEHNNDIEDHNVMEIPTERKQLLIQSFKKNKQE